MDTMAGEGFAAALRFPMGGACISQPSRKAAGAGVSRQTYGASTSQPAPRNEAETLCNFRRMVAVTLADWRLPAAGE
jgi:hypothetical protein